MGVVGKGTFGRVYKCERKGVGHGGGGQGDLTRVRRGGRGMGRDRRQETLT